MKKIVSALIALMLFGGSVSAFKSVECNSSQYFGEMSCDLCFDGGNVNVWENLWVLQDTVVNTTPYSVMIDISEQKDPFMENLQKWLVDWAQIEDDESLWGYAPEASEYLNEEWTAYIVPAGKSTVLTRSSIVWSYNLDRNESEASEIGMVVFPINMRNLDSDGKAGDVYEHRQCVLYKGTKSNVVKKTPIEPIKEEPTKTETEKEETPIPVTEKVEVKKEEPKEILKVEEYNPTKLPTWPEHILLLMLSLALVSILIIRRRV